MFDIENKTRKSMIWRKVWYIARPLWLEVKIHEIIYILQMVAVYNFGVI